MKLLIRWVIVGLALFVAAWLVPGIRVEGSAWFVYAVMAIILGLINAIIKPILKFLSCGLIFITLGLFVLVINGLTLWLASAIRFLRGWFLACFFWRAHCEHCFDHPLGTGQEGRNAQKVKKS